MLNLFENCRIWMPICEPMASNFRKNAYIPLHVVLNIFLWVQHIWMTFLSSTQQILLNRIKMTELSILSHFGDFSKNKSVVNRSKNSNLPEDVFLETLKIPCVKNSFFAIIWSNLLNLDLQTNFMFFGMKIGFFTICLPMFWSKTSWHFFADFWCKSLKYKRLQVESESTSIRLESALSDKNRDLEILSKRVWFISTSFCCFFCFFFCFMTLIVMFTIVILQQTKVKPDPNINAHEARSKLCIIVVNSYLPIWINKIQF